MRRNIAVLIGSMTVMMSAAHAFDFGGVFTDPVDKRLDASFHLDPRWSAVAFVDVARGPEEWAFYIQMGNGWSP